MVLKKGVAKVKNGEDYPSRAKQVGIKDLIASAVIIGMSIGLLWHFSNIWRYGQYLIQEPNVAILSLETVGLLLILAFGITKLISDLRVKGR